MTRNEVKGMSDKTLCAEIARRVGWQQVRECGQRYERRNHMSGILEQAEDLPDYTSNLDAIHDIEPLAIQHNYMAYWAWLTIIVDDLDIQQMSRRIWSNLEVPSRIATASARQRAEAFLLALHSPM